MSEHLSKRFPERYAEIRYLMQDDPTFGEICADYEELATWLSANTETTDALPIQLEEANTLLVELEAEIEQALQPARNSPETRVD